MSAHPYSPAQDEERLDSWKQIASFFDVSVRTAQRWESELGLPVYRRAGAKGRVYAFVSEVRGWHQNALAAGVRLELVATPISETGSADEAESAPTPVEPQPASPATLRAGPRRFTNIRPLVAVSVATALIVLAALGAWRWRTAMAEVPVDWRLSGTVLSALDANGRTVWRHTFAKPPQALWKVEKAYAAPAFLDIDGDGVPELLFPYSLGPEDSTGDTLYCFTRSGSVRWSFQSGATVRTRKDTLAPPYRLTGFQLIPTTGRERPRLVVVGAHFHDDPSQVALLDSEGHKLREYWHTGQLVNLLVADFDADGRSEIYLGGVSNGYRCATVVVLDPANFAGASAESDADYQLLGMPPPVERARVLIPRTKINRALEPYNAMSSFGRAGSDLLADISESRRAGYGAAVSYTFGPRMTLKHAIPSDDAFPVQHRLLLEGRVDSDLTAQEVEKLEKGIRFVTPWRD